MDNYIIVKYTYLIAVVIAYVNTIPSNALAQPVQKWDSVAVNKLPSIPFLPDPLIMDEEGKNTPITYRAQWQKKRQWIKKEYQYWVSGSVPPPTKSVHAETLSDTTYQSGVKDRMVELHFGPDNKAKMTVELMIPSNSQGPLPVFMTQWNHRGWAQVAVRRGYIGCIYAGADIKDDTKNYTELYSDYDFAELMRRAFGGMSVVTYLYALSKVDTSQIALTGHSRNGKQSLMLAAFDQRIDAVVSSSAGTGGEGTFRWSDDRFTPGSFDRMVWGHPWFSPRLDWFVGREQKLPVDQNSLMSLIAPRGLMMVSAITEHEGNPWGVEQSYKSVKQVYHFLHADSAVAIWLRHGRHQHALRYVDRYLDFFDYIFGRSPKAPKNKLYYNYSFKKWKRLSGEHISPLDFPVASNNSPLNFSGTQPISTQKDSIHRRIRWLLSTPPTPSVPNKETYSPNLNANKVYKDDYLSEVIGKPNISDSIKVMKFGPYTTLGVDLWGTMYLPSEAVQHDSVTRKLPLVISLHKYDYARGYRTRKAPRIIRAFTRQGYAVLMFDLTGFGTRIPEAKRFYNRYPHWSKMGDMVTNVRNIISDVRRGMPFIDSNNIYLVGYSLGGTVALFTAALDRHVKGVVAVSAFSSLRHDNKGVEGIRHYYYLHGLIPRLGFFMGHENRIPVDFEGILSSIAPRPLLIIAPKYDRDHTIGSVRNTVNKVSDVYENMHAPEQLTFKHPSTYNHYTNAVRKQIAKWLLQQTSDSKLVPQAY